MSENLNKIKTWWHNQTKIQKATLKLFWAGLAALTIQVYPPLPPTIHIAIIGSATATILGIYLISKRWPREIAIIICGLPAVLTWYYYYANAMSNDINGTLSMAGVMIMIMSVVGDLISSRLIIWMAIIDIIVITISKSLAGEFLDLSNVVLDHQLDFVLIVAFARNFILKHKKEEKEKELRMEAEKRADAEAKATREAQKSQKLAEDKAEIERINAETERLKRKAIEAWTDAVYKFQKSESARREASKLLHSNRITLEKGTIISRAVEKNNGLKLTIFAIDPDTNKDCKYPILIPHKVVTKMNGQLKLDQGNGVKLTGRITSESHPRFKTQVYIKVMKIENTLL